MEIIIHESLPALQCGHATAIKGFNQALRECRPPWWMEIIIPISPQKLWIITYYVHYNLWQKKSATHAKIFQITLQVVVLWDDCHSKCCEVL